ncbi:LuxR family transcriptional regulator [Phycicoccus sonneratiae]|uniref:AAA family ATPase n=1 Tax=Phycicoccus sonneratiae TaxID=2807628 RepID=A0ABS2CNE1_9MICO|nr:LuxR family transcriptional regulator [Phycicoccus sonneraticus]MBM6401348.1 AAA family ATPase [Phycicoccus sonneraticus]
MVVGREAELRRVGGLLAAARLGHGGTLVVVGEAGVGKSTLLEEAAALAGGAGVVRVVGTVAEREVPYAALGLVVGDAAAELAALPAPQAHALGAALALVDGDGPPPFAVGAATLGVLARRAEARPLVLLLDDAHLLDAASARALAFAARRLAADPVIVLAAVRPDEPGPWTTSGFPELVLDGLGEDAVGALLGELGHASSREVAARAREATGGNPLAVSELVRRHDARALLEAGGPLPLPRDLVEVFSERARAAGQDVRLVVALTALAGRSAAVVSAAAAAVGLADDAVDRAERAGLVTLDGGTVAPSHPLVGSAVYSGLDAAVRRRLHAAVADALPPGRTDERAHHLAAAAAGPDEALAAALEDVAAVAAGRAAPSAAAAGLERAAAISPDPARAADRRLRAAAHAWVAGDSQWAIELCDRAAHDFPVDRWRAEALTGTVAARTGSLDVAGPALLAAVTTAPSAEVDAVSRALCELVNAAFYRADPSLAAAAGEHAAALLARGVDGPARGRCLMVVGMAEVLAGRPGESALAGALNDLGALDPRCTPTGGHDPRSDDDAAWALVTSMWLRGDDAADDLARAIDARRSAWALGSLPRLLFHLGRDAATRDRWPEARSAYAEAIELAHELGHVTDEAIALAGLAWVEARTGDRAECAAHADAAVALAAPRANRMADLWARLARGDAALAAGDAEDAARRYSAVAERLESLGLEDVDLHPGPELAECLVLLGRREEAVTVVDRYAARARVKARPWALARAARAEGLLADPDGVDEQFAVAAGLHARTGDAFESARSALLHGQRLRRLRRRADARAPLRAALEVFERLGARPWADRAAAELEATGEPTARRGTNVLDALTPRERQIVVLVTDGLTTRETALRLFLSPKTVEYHLRNVYARLGITSRAELASLVRDGRGR